MILILSIHFCQQFKELKSSRITFTKREKGIFCRTISIYDIEVVAIQYIYIEKDT